MSDAKKASDLATSELAVLFRVGAAWRELRRGASMQAFRPMVYGEGDEALDLGQVDALDLLVFHGSARMGELAEALRVDASTATRAVNRLVDAGLAQRRRSDDDGRVMVVAITKRGTEVHRALMARRRDAIEGILADFNQRDRAELARLLEGFVAGLDAYVAGNPAAEPRAS
jgi:DNA-binding MarR family transcriptional regulator